MDFIQVWFLGYLNPRKYVDALQNKPAPHWGLYALILRSLADALLLYLPLAVMGRRPPTPSFLTFIATDKYYQALIWLTPLVFLMQWLLGSAVIHLTLRLGKQKSNMDQILNLTGMSSIVIAAVLLVWDWFWYFLGGMNQYVLGVSHLLMDIWWFVLIVTGLNRNMEIPKKYGVVVSILAFIVAFPFAVIFMRAPF